MTVKMFNANTFLIPLLLLLITTSIFKADATKTIPMGIVSITRGIESAPLSDSMFRDEEENTCRFNGTITMGGPFSLEQEDKFFGVGSRQRVSYQLVVDYVNRFRCGISLLSGHYAIELRSYDDQSSTEWTTAIGRAKLADDDVDIILGGYSSTLTKPLAEIAHENGKLLMAPGAASTAVFAGREQVFGTLPPTAKYLAAAIEGLAGVGAKSIATVFEDASFAKGVCGAAPDLSATFGLVVTSTNEVGPTPNTTVLEPVAQILSEEDPDIVVACVYDCVPWMNAMRNTNWSPKAQVFTVCVGLEDFSNEVGTDAQYIFGVTPWDASLNIQDPVTGWSAKDFADTFRKETADTDVTYHASSAASVISITVQSIEATDTIDQAILGKYITSHSFKTMHGEVSFDLNGQSLAPSLLIQYDDNGTVQTVFPIEISSAPILFPMPSWNQRDCALLSACESLGHACGENGQCICDNSLGRTWRSVGSGVTARCTQVEDMNYINKALLHLTYACMALVMLAAAFSLGWVFKYRENILVQVSQPMFLSLIIAGTFISSSSIIPMGVQTSYRDSSSIQIVDFACMATPWLYGLGFTITFSALFAKVWRVKKLYNAGNAMKRRQVKTRDVIFIMLVMVAIEASILIAFQVLSPHRWERNVIKEVDGYPIESIGQCNSEHGWWYIASLVGFNILSLFYALVLCWQVKDIPSNFSESSYIFLSVMFMFQVLVIAVPVSVMVRDDTNVFFFIRAAAVFLQNLTVLVIIFLPKILRVYKNEDSIETIQQQVFETVSRRSRQLKQNPQKRDTYRQSRSGDLSICSNIMRSVPLAAPNDMGHQVNHDENLAIEQALFNFDDDMHNHEEAATTSTPETMASAQDQRQHQHHHQQHEPENPERMVIDIVENVVNESVLNEMYDKYNNSKNDNNNNGHPPVR